MMMMKKQLIFLLAVVFCTATCDADRAVLVVGATGRTGSAVYLLLKQSGIRVHALVRNVTKARSVLGCNRCDAQEGVFIADVTKSQTLTRELFDDTGTVIIATGPDVQCNPYPQNCTCPKGACPVDVDWHGGKNVITKFAQTSAAHGLGRVLMISSDCTTYPGCSDPSPGPDPLKDPLNGHFKLDCEAFLMSSGLPFTIVKPCGLTDDPPAQAALETFHDDEKTSGHGTIARADIARLLLAAILHESESAGLRFDFCSTTGPPTPDSGLVDVLRSARYPWERSGSGPRYRA